MQQVAALPTAPSELRGLMRRGELSGLTSGMAPGRVQANLVILPREQAFDFLLFCQRNPKPCPLLEVVEVGSSEPRAMAPGADLRTDLPRYRVFEYGELVEEPTDIGHVWRDDMVSFLLGCSFTFESALVNAGIRIPHYETGNNTAMFVTSIETEPAGIFSGPMVVSMRSIPQDKVVKAVQITSRYPAVHGAPVHIGNPGGHWRGRRAHARPRRCRTGRRGGRAGILGLRRHAPGCGHVLQAAAHDHARPPATCSSPTS